MLPVTSLLTGLNTLGALFGRAPAGNTAVQQPAAPPEAEAVDGFSASGSLRELASRHDLTKISPEDFSSLARQLYQAGAIDERQLQDLAAVRLELDLAELPANQPVNVLAFLQEKQQRLQGQLSGADGGTNPTISATDYNEAADRVARQLEFLQEFQQARAGSLDATI